MGYTFEFGQRKWVVKRERRRDQVLERENKGDERGKGHQDIIERKTLSEDSGEKRTSRSDRVLLRSVLWKYVAGLSRQVVLARGKPGGSNHVCRSCS